MNALFASCIILAAAVLYALQECAFLAPRRAEILRLYGKDIALFAAALLFNLWAALHMAGRHIALRRTGRKLDHLDSQLRSEGEAEQLASRLEEKR